MNKLISYLYRREQRKDDEEEERHFIEGFDGGQSKRTEKARRLVRRDRLINRIGVVFTVIAGIAAILALLH